MLFYAATVDAFMLILLPLFVDCLIEKKLLVFVVGMDGSGARWKLFCLKKIKLCFSYGIKRDITAGVKRTLMLLTDEKAVKWDNIESVY